MFKIGNYTPLTTLQLDTREKMRTKKTSYANAEFFFSHHGEMKYKIFYIYTYKLRTLAYNE